jgi:thiol-disulfide isomerase/thioredoxin
MRFPVTAVMALAVSMPAVRTLQGSDSQSPAERYSSLLDEYRRRLKDFTAATQQAKTEEERRAAFEEKRPDNSAFAARFWKLAEDHPDDPAAVDALVWVALHVPDHPLSDKALALLLERHIKSEKLGPVCRRLASSAEGQVDGTDVERLRRILAENPHRSVKGPACFELGNYFKGRAEMVRYARQAAADVVEQAEAEHGKDAIRRLRAENPDDLTREAERLLDRAKNDYGDIEYYYKKRGTLSEAARLQLDEIRSLAVGMAAPEIASVDLDGERMSLADYRGKVVVLSFWASWCAPCMEMVPHERSLVERLRGQPFALLGVNGDENKADAERAATREKMTWRSWWDGGQVGPIVTAWNVSSWPTVYVLDAQGVIRYKNLRGKELDEAVDTLLKEVRRSGPDAR